MKENRFKTVNAPRSQWRLRHFCWSLQFLFLLAVVCPRASAAPAGLYLKDGRLMKDGHPFAAVGANYFGLFGRILQNQNETSTLRNLGRLSQAGIPFVRFRAGGFSPQDWQLYRDNRTEYFRRLDLVVRAAEKEHIGLIPSLFWRQKTIPELVGEAPAQLGNDESNSIAFIRHYTREVVGRYKDSPAIWGWEFGNEGNLVVDFNRRPNRMKEMRSGPFGAEQSDADPGVKLTSRQLANAYTEFGRAVRRLDPERIISGGTTVPRPGAWHNARGIWGTRDNEQQSYDALLEQNLDPIDLLSVHIYQKARKLAPYGPETVDHFIGRYAAFARRMGKPLFVGEFPTRDRKQAEEYLAAITKNAVPLSAFWVFDYPPQEGGMNVTFENGLAFVLPLIAEANRKIRERP